MGINFFDVVLLFIFVGFAMFSYLRGAVREIASLAGLGIGYLVAMAYYGELGGMLKPIVRDQSLAEVLAILMIMALGYLVGTFVSGFGEMVRMNRPGPVNSIAGAMVGLLKGLVVAMALFWIIDGYITPFQDELAESTTAPYLARMLAVLTEYNLL